MRIKEPPLTWRRGFSLYRRRLETDSRGEQVSRYHMDTPDYTAQDGTAEGMDVQRLQSWQSAGQVTSGARRERFGEELRNGMQAFLYSALEISPYDRIGMGGEVYEVRDIQVWQHYRKLLLQRIG